MQRHAAGEITTRIARDGQVYARYINVAIQKKFAPIFGTQYFPGANSDGTFTLKSDAGIRTQ